MKKQFTAKELKEIASQLGCPQGEQGFDIGEKMHESNISMTLKTAEALRLSGNERLLEIGHGNCGHLRQVLTDNIRYYGLEISELMHREAAKTNLEYTRRDRASFHMYDGTKIPFESNFFHKIMTVNTIYFWKEPARMLNEIYRVLRDKGHVSIGFAQKSFMLKLPFVRYGFELYDTEKTTNLLSRAGFKIAGMADQTEQIENKTGETVTREFTVVVAEKPGKQLTGE